MNDMIVNDLVIINENCLETTSESMVENNFDKSDEMNSSYFIGSIQDSSTCAATNNESSNEASEMGK